MSGIAEADPWWRWKVDRPSPEVLACTIENLIAAGYELVPARWPVDTSKTTGVLKEWRRPHEGGFVFGVLTDHDGEFLTHHAVDRFGHWDPPCTECGLPISKEGGRTVERCHTCRFWLEKVADPSEWIIAIGWNGLTDGHACYHDSGNRPHTRPADKSHLGFGGREFRIRRLADGHEWTTNNLYCQGGVPELFRDRLPITHEFVEAPPGPSASSGTDTHEAAP